MENLKQIKEVVASMETDATKFYDKRNKSAGVRYRNQLNELRKLAMMERNNVLLN